MGILNKIKGSQNTPENEAETIRKDLAKFDNIEDMLLYLLGSYDLKNVKPNILEKPFVIDGLVKTYTQFKPKKK